MEDGKRPVILTGRTEPANERRTELEARSNAGTMEVGTSTARRCLDTRMRRGRRVRRGRCRGPLLATVMIWADQAAGTKWPEAESRGAAGACVSHGAGRRGDVRQGRG
jgi:hypothetical protein